MLYLWADFYIYINWKLIFSFILSIWIPVIKLSASQIISFKKDCVSRLWSKNRAFNKSLSCANIAKNKPQDLKLNFILCWSNIRKTCIPKTQTQITNSTCENWERSCIISLCWKNLNFFLFLFLSTLSFFSTKRSNLFEFAVTVSENIGRFRMLTVCYALSNSLHSISKMQLFMGFFSFRYFIFILFLFTNF